MACLGKCVPDASKQFESLSGVASYIIGSVSNLVTHVLPSNGNIGNGPAAAAIPNKGAKLVRE